MVGNPPFLGGQKLTGAFGIAYREFLVKWVAGGARGSADLLAYFLLTAHRLLNERGQTGLIGTNTMAQGDTREVGLDQLTSNGATIRAAIKSAHWPTRTVHLEYAVLWSSRASPATGVPRVFEGRRVALISSSLDPAETHLAKPFRLKENAGIAFQGSNVLGLGFTMAPEEAARLIQRNTRNRDVLFPYINGEDLNSRPDCSASRWVINFRDWPLERAETYPDCIDIVRRLVAQNVRVIATAPTPNSMVAVRETAPRAPRSDREVGACASHHSDQQSAATGVASERLRLRTQACCVCVGQSWPVCTGHK